MTWQEILNGAADYIAEHGHAKGAYLTDDGCACAIGAMRMAAFGRPGIPDGVDFKPYGVARMQLETEILYLTQWNDAPERTAQEVIDTMRRVACG